MAYAVLVRENGWPLSEAKALTYRERSHWIALASYWMEMKSYGR